MFVFGHIGFGRLVVGARGRALPVLPFVLGTLLPDIIDKPLYYSYLFDYVTCTRTFGHTGLLLTTIAAVAYFRRWPAAAAVALGGATHLLFDGILDIQSQSTSSTWMAATWPFIYGRFATMDVTPLQQLFQIKRLDIIITEAIGLWLIVREYRRRTVPVG